MAPTISYQEIRHISHGPRSAQSLSPQSTRHRIRALVNISPLPYTPTVDLRPSVLLSTDTPAMSNLASDPARSDSALPQLQAARNRATVITAVLITVCVLVGLTACTVIGRLVYRRRLSLLRCFRGRRQAEDKLGFVFIEYDDSTWGIPAKEGEVWKEIPLFDTGTGATEGGEVRARVVSSGPLIPRLETNRISTVHPRAVEASPGSGRSRPPLPLGAAESSLCRAGNDTDGRDPSDAGLAEATDPCFKICPGVEHGNAGYRIRMVGPTLASPQLAAALALRAGKVDDLIEATGFTIADSLSSDMAACGVSTESSSEEDYELQRVATRSMDFKRGIVVSLQDLPRANCEEDKKPSLDVYNLPRLVISASPSVVSEVFSSRSNRVSGMSEATVDLGEFPRPPYIGNTLAGTSTSLISEIEVSLGPVISGGLGMKWRRASSAPQLAG
ncbi:hypothetical protein BC826DRAFT_998377 [Russula brevipes]|nr:hypothetical protein BC826DRAFT_998377 [Russula brevipes]